MVAHPTEVEFVESQAALRVRFSDDVEIVYPVALLRGFCPCAHCQGHGAGPPKWKPARHARGLVIENVTPVGTYGMCIVWGDGHDTGIYAFEMLRRIIVDGFDAGAMTPDSVLPLEPA